MLFYFQQSEHKSSDCIAITDEAVKTTSTNTVVALSTANLNKFNHSSSTLNLTPSFGALNKQHSPSPPLFDQTDNFIKQEIAPETSASSFVQSITFCDNKNPSSPLIKSSG